MGSLVPNMMLNKGALILLVLGLTNAYPKKDNALKAHLSFSVSLGKFEKLDNSEESRSMEFTELAEPAEPRWIHMCQGTILSDRTIATSVDCMKKFGEDVTCGGKIDESKLQVRVGAADFDDVEEFRFVKNYAVDGVKMNENYNIAVIATTESIAFGEKVQAVTLPEETTRFDYHQSVEARTDVTINLAFWEEDEEFESFDFTQRKKCSDPKNCISDDTEPISSCEGNGAALVMDCMYWTSYHNKDMKSKCEDNEKILVGVLSDSSEYCQNEIKDDKDEMTRRFARTDHPEVLKFIKDMKKDLETCQSLKDCFCELRELSC